MTVGVDSDKSVAVWRSCSGEWFDAELQVQFKMTMSEYLFGLFLLPGNACW